MVIRIYIGNGELPCLVRLRKGPLDIATFAEFHPYVIQRPILARLHLLSQRDGLAAPHLDAEHTVCEGHRTPLAAVLYVSARFGRIIRYVYAVNIGGVVCVPVQNLSPFH
jgi:hypothetical protein